MKKYVLLFLLFYPLLTYSQYDGIVGTEGCKAIHCKDKRIIAWADNCVVVRGYQDIAKPENGFVSYGNEQNALGAANDTDATNAISLGDGGYAVLSFTTPIVNGEGADFVVFENSLNDVFLELAFVEVSSDNVHFVRFPASSFTPTDQQVGSFGSVDARHINHLAGKYRIGWGTPFDLSVLADSGNLDINNIRYVKIIDVVGCIDSLYASYDAEGRIINDPYPTNFASGGFDLSGVGVIHNATSAIKNANSIAYKVYPNPCSDYIIVEGDCASIIIYNSVGQLIKNINVEDNLKQIDVSSFPAGIYYLCVNAFNQSKQYIKIIKHY
jgi:hypothetical protein